MSLPWYEQATLHFLSGVSISLCDRLFSKNAKRHTQERTTRKLEQVTALQYLAETEPRADRVEASQNREYFDAVLKAKEYFMENGVSFRETSHGVKDLAERVSEAASFYRNHERFNNLPSGKKLAAAFGLELLGDFGVFLSQVTTGYGDGLVSFGETIYQGPSLFLGLQLGKGVLYVKDLLMKSKEEKELDKITKQLTEDGKLLSIVTRYSPTKYIEVHEVEQKQLPEAKDRISATEIGDKVGETIANTAQGIGRGIGAGIGAIRERIEAGKRKEQEAEEERKKALSDKYKDY